MILIAFIFTLKTYSQYPIQNSDKSITFSIEQSKYLAETHLKYLYCYTLINEYKIKDSLTTEQIKTLKLNLSVFKEQLNNYKQLDSINSIIIAENDLKRTKLEKKNKRLKTALIVTTTVSILSIIFLIVK